jgi:hypothetical protein
VGHDDEAEVLAFAAAAQLLQQLLLTSSIAAAWVVQLELHTLLELSLSSMIFPVSCCACS